jgi:hypothetical protein
MLMFVLDRSLNILLMVLSLGFMRLIPSIQIPPCSILGPLNLVLFGMTRHPEDGVVALFIGIMSLAIVLFTTIVAVGLVIVTLFFLLPSQMFPMTVVVLAVLLVSVSRV